MRRVVQIALDIGRTEYMSGTLQTNPAVQCFVFDQTEPVIEWQRDDSLVDELQVTLYLFGVMRKLDLQDIFHDQWQQMGAGLAAQYGPLVARGQQLGDTPDMVIVYMGDQQRSDGLGIEPE